MNQIAGNDQALISLLDEALPSIEKLQKTINSVTSASNDLHVLSSVQSRPSSIYESIPHHTRNRLATLPSPSRPSSTHTDSIVSCTSTKDEIEKASRHLIQSLFARIDELEAQVASKAGEGSDTLERVRSHVSKAQEHFTALQVIFSDIQSLLEEEHDDHIEQTAPGSTHSSTRTVTLSHLKSLARPLNIETPETVDSAVVTPRITPGPDPKKLGNNTVREVATIVLPNVSDSLNLKESSDDVENHIELVNDSATNLQQRAASHAFSPTISLQQQDKDIAASYLTRFLQNPTQLIPASSGLDTTSTARTSSTDLLTLFETRANMPNVKVLSHSDQAKAAEHKNQAPIETLAGLFSQSNIPSTSGAIEINKATRTRAIEPGDEEIYYNLPEEFDHGGSANGDQYSLSRICQRKEYKPESIPVVRMQYLPRDTTPADIFKVLAGGPIYRCHLEDDSETGHKVAKITFMHAAHAEAFVKYAEERGGIKLGNDATPIKVEKDWEKVATISHNVFRRMMSDNCTRSILVRGFRTDIWDDQNIKELLVHATERKRKENPDKFRFKEPCNPEIDIERVIIGIGKLEVYLHMRTLSWGMMAFWALEGLEDPEKFLAEATGRHYEEVNNSLLTIASHSALKTEYVRDPCDKPLA